MDANSNRIFADNRPFKEDMMPRALVAVVALSAIVSMPGFAQPAPPAATGALMSHSAVMLADHTMRASKLIGSPVYNDEGEKIGTVDDIIVTASATEPTVVVSVGGFLGVGEKFATEPLSHVKLGKGDKMMMPGATKAALTAKSSFKALMAMSVDKVPIR